MSGYLTCPPNAGPGNMNDKANAEKFWKSKITKIDMNAAYQAASAFEVDIKRTVKKLKTLQPQQLTAMHSLLEKHEQDARFEKIFHKNVTLVTAYVRDLAGLNSYVKIIKGKFGEIDPMVSGSGRSTFLFRPVDFNDSKVVDTVSYAHNYMADYREIFNDVIVYCVSLEDKVCEAGKIEDLKTLNAPSTPALPPNISKNIKPKIQL